MIGGKSKRVECKNGGERVECENGESERVEKVKCVWEGNSV